MIAACLCFCSLCKYLMVASGRASVFILRARAKTVIKVFILPFLVNSVISHINMHWWFSCQLNIGLGSCCWSYMCTWIGRGGMVSQMVHHISFVLWLGWVVSAFLWYWLVWQMLLALIWKWWFLVCEQLRSLLSREACFLFGLPDGLCLLLTLCMCFYMYLIGSNT